MILKMSKKSKKHEKSHFFVTFWIKKVSFLVFFDDFFWSKKVKKVTFFVFTIIIWDLRKSQKKWLFFIFTIHFWLFWSKKVKKSDFLWLNSHFLFKKSSKVTHKNILFFLIRKKWFLNLKKSEMNEIFEWQKSQKSTCIWKKK